MSQLAAHTVHGAVLVVALNLPAAHGTQVLSAVWNVSHVVLVSVPGPHDSAVEHGLHESEAPDALYSDPPQAAQPRSAKAVHVVVVFMPGPHAVLHWVHGRASPLVALNETPAMHGTHALSLTAPSASELQTAANPSPTLHELVHESHGPAPTVLCWNFGGG